MKAGDIVRFAPPIDPTEYQSLYHLDGISSSPEHGNRDAAVAVEEGKYARVFVCKVLAVVRRSAKVE